MYRVNGPNSEIEWNKEGSRGYLIINRSTSQTALSMAADDASNFGDKLNKHLKEPADTARDRYLKINSSKDENIAKNLVTADPKNVSSIFFKLITTNNKFNDFINFIISISINRK